MASEPGRFEVLAARLGRGPADGPAAFELAQLACDAGRQAEALPLVERAAAGVGRSATLFQWAGVLARDADQLETAVRNFAAAARLAPADARIANGHALSTLEAGSDAGALFDRVLALSPLDESALLGRAAARVAAGDGDRALAEIEAVLAGNPGWLRGHQRATQLAMMMGRGEPPGSSIARALAATPQDPALWRTWLALLLLGHRYGDVLAVARRARATAGTDVEFDIAEAAALSELGDDSTAETIFTALATVDNTNLRVRRIRHLLRTGRIADAARLAETRVGAADEGAYWPYLAIAWRALGDPRWAWLEGWPGAIARFDLRARIRDFDGLAHRLRALHRNGMQFFDQSVRGGTQTDGPLFSRADPAIAALRAACVDAIGEHIAGLPPPDPAHPLLRARRDQPPHFAGSWSVRLTDGGHHETHIHPEGWMSSAFYIAVPGASDDPEAGHLVLGQPPVELRVDLPPLAVIAPEPGLLVLFPSTMWHGTRPFPQGERLTVAFDVADPGLPR